MTTRSNMSSSWNAAVNLGSAINTKRHVDKYAAQSRERFELLKSKFERSGQPVVRSCPRPKKGTGTTLGAVPVSLLI
jgi:hypothetical protein